MLVSPQYPKSSMQMVPTISRQNIPAPMAGFTALRMVELDHLQGDSDRPVDVPVENGGGVDLDP